MTLHPHPEGFWENTALAHSFRCLLSPALLHIPWPKVPRIDCFRCRRVEEHMTSCEVKCCDVVPVLANFLVGEILSHTPHPVVEDWISQHRGDPYAIWVPPEVSAYHLSARKHGRYGSPCPLLYPGQGLQGTCSVYAHRPALCVGYHCYYPNRLWQEAWACFTSTLELWQDAAARYLVTLFSFDLQKMAVFWEQEPASLWQNNQQVPAFYQACWQHWQGKEREFYVQCYRTLCELGPEQRRAICDLQRQHLMDRMAQQGQTTTSQYTALAQEFIQRDQLQLTPLPPASDIREQLQRGAVAAEDNTLSIHQQESILLWYALQLQQAQTPSWWEKLWKAKPEIREQAQIRQDSVLPQQIDEFNDVGE